MLPALTSTSWIHAREGTPISSLLMKWNWGLLQLTSYCGGAENSMATRWEGDHSWKMKVMIMRCREKTVGKNQACETVARGGWICRMYEHVLFVCLSVSMYTVPIGYMWVWAHVSLLSKPAWWHWEQGGGGDGGQFFQLVNSLWSDESFNTKALTSNPFVCSASFKLTFKVFDFTPENPVLCTHRLALL